MSASTVSRVTPAPTTVLILTATRWISTARLALAFQQVGCRVELLGHRRHPALAAGAIACRHRFVALAPVRSLRNALAASAANVIVPADEWSVGYLTELLAQEPAGAPLRLRIEAALGSQAGLQMPRIELMRLAAALGVATPETAAVDTESELQATLARWPLPFLLKADATAGGRGVHVLNTEAEPLRLWRKLHEPLSLARAVRRALRFGEWEYLRATLRKDTRSVVAQRFVHGAERTVMAVADHGRVTVCVAFEVVHTWYVRGPSSVLRLVDDPRLCAAAQAICGALQTTGLCGFDFMMDAATGTPHLIEMNARPTQLAHLPLGPGRDLIAACLRAVAKVEVADRPSVTNRDCIALFPQEIHRDPESEALAEAFHDVPWECPALIRKALRHLPAVIQADPRWHG